MKVPNTMKTDDKIRVPSVAELRWKAMEALRPFKSFIAGLDQFGREPGEAWHAAADEMIGRFMALEKLAQSLKGKTILPRPERETASRQIKEALIRLMGLREQLLEEIPSACAPVDTLEAPDPKSQALWLAYDLLAQKSGIRRYERSRIQRMLRRAHTPGSVLQMVTYHSDDEEIGVWVDLFQGFQTLLMTTPLPRFRGRSVIQVQQEARQQALTKDRDPAQRDTFFEQFVAGIRSSRPEERKQARRALEKLRSKTWEERNGPMLGREMLETRKMLAVWDGVRAALDHANPVYRRAALCALPILQFTFILADFADETVAFIVKGLQDTDRMTRFKVMRFGHDFFMTARTDLPQTAAELEKEVRELRRRLRKTHPEAAQTAEKLIRGIEWFHRYDRQRGIGAQKG